MIIQLKAQGVLEVTGQDPKAFLQGQLTKDLRSITARHSHLVAYANLQGRLVAIGRLYAPRDTQILWRLPKALIPSVQKTLERYARFSKVSVQDASEDWSVYGILHPSFTELPTLSLLKQPNETLSGTDGIFTKLDEIRYECLIPSNAPLMADTDDPTLWQQHDIMAKLPTVTPALQGECLPHHLNCDQLNIVDFNKGCYLGQEIIARMHYKGLIKMHLYRVLITSPAPLASGMQLIAPDSTQPWGRIIDTVQVADGWLTLLSALDIHMQSNAGTARILEPNIPIHYVMH